MLNIDVVKAEFAGVLSHKAHLWRGEPTRETPELTVCSIADPSMILVSTNKAGLTSEQVSDIRTVLREIESGRANRPQYLVFELKGGPNAGAAVDMREVLVDVSDLVVKLPVITVGWARGELTGDELELAIACNLLVAEPQARFSFELDLVTSLRTYSTLARKIGFVRAERLMETGTKLGVQQMEELFLLKQLPSFGEGLDRLRTFIHERARRHNAACGIYRAQRLAIVGP